MDRLSTLIGIVLLAVAFVLLSWNAQKQAPPANNSAQEAPPEMVLDESVPAVSPRESTDAASIIFTTRAPETDRFDAVVVEELPPEILANEFMRVAFSRYGGGIQKVSLLQYPAVKDQPAPYQFDTTGNPPALSLSYSKDGSTLNEFSPLYEVLEKTDRSISLRSEVRPGIYLERHYTLSTEKKGVAPYLIEHTTRFKNESTTDFDIQELYLNIGAAAPTDADPQGLYLNFAHYNGDKARFINLNEFKPSNGFLGIGRRQGSSTLQEHTSLKWAAVKNQFFAAIATPAIPAKGYLTQPILLSSNATKQTQEGISGNLLFGFNQLRAGTERTLAVQYYIGPKEYPRLSELEQEQDLIMQFGFFGLFSRWLLTALIALQSILGNYGVAIIAMTVIIRLLLWPLTAQSARASQRMAELQGPLKELRERFQGKPEKLRKESVKLFKEYQINPASGCIPILIQIPIFIAFFYMLRTASELRFAEFLWIQDLSQPENLFHWGANIPLIGDSFNLLPLLMGLTMFYLMRRTPTTMDKGQQLMLQYFLPIVFTAICYTFSSGLVLYWTTSNILSILQQVLIRRQQHKLALDKPKLGSEPARKQRSLQNTKKHKRRPALATYN